MGAVEESFAVELEPGEGVIRYYAVSVSACVGFKGYLMVGSDELESCSSQLYASY